MTTFNKKTYIGERAMSMIRIDKYLGEKTKSFIDADPKELVKWSNDLQTRIESDDAKGALMILTKIKKNIIPNLEKQLKKELTKWKHS
jgi:hypothetical protein